MIENMSLCREKELINLKKRYEKNNIIFYNNKYIQRLPRTKSEEIYYGKDIEYDKEVKNKIDRTNSLIRNGVQEYTNGNILVIVPCLDKNYK